MQYLLYLYRSEEDYNEGRSYVKDVNEIERIHVQTFTAEEYATLNPVSIHDELKLWVMEEIGTDDGSKVEIQL